MDSTKRKALKFVILLGLVSLLADMTYEGARSITGQYLALLGASGAGIGFVAGFGEFIGYGFRLVSGYISDKTGRYWFMAFLGYSLNLFAVPLLAFATSWPAAAGLIIVERFGKAFRTPSRDAMLSYATQGIGRGLGFGLHKALDQIGAFSGPLLLTAMLYYQNSYQTCFAILFIPAVLAICLLAYARALYPRPQDLEPAKFNIQTKGFSKNYWLYMIAVSCIGAGYLDFPLIAYHLQKKSIASEFQLPLLFALSMLGSALSGLLLGRLYDRYGMPVFIGTTATTLFFTPLIFLSDNMLSQKTAFYSSLAGILLWGFGLGAQDSIMRAIVANLVQPHQRGTGYGILNIWFGAAWFLGSVIMGMLYDFSPLLLVAFSIFFQLLSLPFLWLCRT